MALVVSNSTSLLDIITQNSNIPWCLLCQLSHSSFPSGQPINVCSNIKPVISKALDGATYLYFLGWRFDIQFMSDKYNEPPMATAVIDNSDPAGTVGTALLNIAQPGSSSIALDPVGVTVGLITLTDPDTLIASQSGMKARAARGTDDNISTRLQLEDILHLPIAARIDPSRIPGAFGGPQAAN